jgi:hypothetical protein
MGELFTSHARSYLKNNLISSLANGTFASCASLRLLYARVCVCVCVCVCVTLCAYSVRCILSVGVFKRVWACQSHCCALSRSDLSNNRIASLPKGGFSTLAYLIEL